MAKLVSVVGCGESEVRTYGEQLRSLFLDEIDLRLHCVGDAPLSIEAEADLVLFPSYDAFERSGYATRGPGRVLFGSRTLTKAGFAKILAIPDGSRVFLFDETQGMARDMVGVLLQMGVRHLELLPASPERGVDCAGATAVVLGRPFSASGGAEKVVDIGCALLDVGTIIDLGIRLNLDQRIHRQNIRERYAETVTANLGLAEILGKTNRDESSLEILLQAIESGFVAVGVDGRIFSCNEKAKSMMALAPGEVLGLLAAEVFPQVPFDRVLGTKAPVRESLSRIGGRDVAYSVDPILHSGQLYGAIAVFNRYSEEERSRHRIKARLLGKGYKARHSFGDISGVSPAITRCKDIARRMAESNSSILICGESGTGKEMFAQAIHNSSNRREFPFVAFNCGALPESLLESELFGYEEGAFTGARKGGKPGLFELAHRGTLFLDEIGEMPLNLQMRLLRVLEEREVMRLGSDQLIDIDIRVVAATNRALKDLVKEGRFREDLFYRLNVLPLNIPPLRDRPEDIAPLLKEFQRIYDCAFETSAEVDDIFRRHTWRGNGRELRNYVEFFANLGIRRVEASDLPFDLGETISDAMVEAPRETTRNGTVRSCDDGGKRLFVLEELERAYGAQLRLGRRSLYLRAKERCLFISEQEIRSILKDLEQSSLVVINPGKSGTFITELGRKVLKSLKTG